MGNNKSKRRKSRRRGRQQSGRSRGGLMLGMRSGFKGIADSVSGQETAASQKYKWWGRIITVLLLLAAVGFLATKF